MVGKVQQLLAWLDEQSEEATRVADEHSDPDVAQQYYGREYALDDVIDYVQVLFEDQLEPNEFGSS